MSSMKMLLTALLALVLVACSPAQFGTTPQPTPPSAAAEAPAVPQPSLSSETAAACIAGKTTPSQMEGPYFKAGSPERQSLLEAGTRGTKLVLMGQVFSLECEPIPGALLDFWQADDGGAYDNSGFKLRGHQFSDGEGRYRLETVVPGLYPGRTRHIHVRVQAPNGPLLVTQLYFPAEPRNSSDGLFNPGLVISVQNVADGKQGAFNFVVDVP